MAHEMLHEHIDVVTKDMNGENAGNLVESHEGEDYKDDDNIIDDYNDDGNVVDDDDNGNVIVDDFNVDGSDTDHFDDHTVNDSNADGEGRYVSDSIVNGANRDKDFAHEPNDVLIAARYNDVSTLSNILHHKPEWASYRDENGWQALHEATRAGHIDAVQILVEKGHADVNARTGKHTDGGSVLWWADLVSIPADSLVVVYLVERGALIIPPV